MACPKCSMNPMFIYAMFMVIHAEYSGFKKLERDEQEKLYLVVMGLTIHNQQTEHSHEDDITAP